MALIPIKPEPKEEHPGKEGTAITDLTKTLRKLDSAPGTAHANDERNHKQIPVDLIEEESMESFPASDPPGHHQASP